MSLRVSHRLVAIVFGASVAACSPARPPPAAASVAAPSGLFWGRWADVPDGIRVQVWLHGVGDRLRGSWDLPPWHGEFSGTRDAAGRWQLVWREEGVVAGLQARARVVTLASDRRTGALRGGDVTLTPAGAPSPQLRPGLWLGRWTGLPPGMAVETVLSRDPGGRWRAAYRYQEREGMFEGEPIAGTSIAIRWREVSSVGRVAEGRGVLHPTTLGLSGTYGIGEADEGTGRWSLEPAEETR